MRNYRETNPRVLTFSSAKPLSFSPFKFPLSPSFSSLEHCWHLLLWKSLSSTSFSRISWPVASKFPVSSHPCWRLLYLTWISYFSKGHSSQSLPLNPAVQYCVLPPWPNTWLDHLQFMLFRRATVLLYSCNVLPKLLSKITWVFFSSPPNHFYSYISRLNYLSTTI